MTLLIIIASILFYSFYKYSTFKANSTKQIVDESIEIIRNTKNAQVQKSSYSITTVQYRVLPNGSLPFVNWNNFGSSELPWYAVESPWNYVRITVGLPNIRPGNYITTTNLGNYRPAGLQIRSDGRCGSSVPPRSAFEARSSFTVRNLTSKLCGNLGSHFYRKIKGKYEKI